MAINRCCINNFATIKMCKRINKNERFEKGEIPFYKIGTLGEKPNEFITKKKYQKYKKYSFPDKGDVMMTCSGTLGKIWIYDGRDCFFQDSNIVWFELNKKKCIKKYFSYLLKKIEWKSIISGSTIPRLYNKDIYGVRVNLPDLQTQQEIINIIEPFENKKVKLLEIRNYFQNLIKNIYFKSQSKKTVKISDVFEIKRNKKIDSKEVIELSSLNSYELFNSHFGNINDFKTNIFSIKKHDIYISTIRPKLKKFGIAWKDSNILGTICVLSGNIENITSLLGLLLQEDFIKKCILNSYGTKMPILDKKWLVQNEFKKLNENEIDLIKKIINYVSNLSEQIFLLEKIINSLILLYII